MLVSQSPPRLGMWGSRSDVRRRLRGEGYGSHRGRAGVHKATIGRSDRLPGVELLWKLVLIAKSSFRAMENCMRHPNLRLTPPALPPNHRFRSLEMKTMTRRRTVEGMESVPKMFRLIG